MLAGRRGNSAILGAVAAGMAILASGSSAEPWKLDLNANATISANTYSDNWTGGEAGAISWVVQTNSAAEKQMAPFFLNKDKLKLAFGQTLVQDRITKHWAPPAKSSDLIDVELLGQFTLKWVVDPFVGLRGVSQFLDRSDTLLDRYINPFDLTESFGAAYDAVKNEQINWSVRLAGAVHQKIDRQKLDIMAASRETDVTNDGGLELVTDFKAFNKAKWLSFATTFRLYEALFTSLPGADTLTDWRYPTVNWENTLTINLLKYVMLNGYLQLLYDKQVHENARFKETVGLGVTFTYKTP